MRVIIASKSGLVKCSVAWVIITMKGYMMTDIFDSPLVSQFLRNQHGASYDWIAPVDGDDQLYTAAEVRAMIKLALMEAETNTRRQLNEFKADLMRQIADVMQQERLWHERQYALLESSTRPSAEGAKPLPAPDQITKITAQKFDNRHKSKEERQGQAAIQLKVCVWTCAPELVERYPEGNGYWYVPLHRPDDKDGRRCITEIMPAIDEIGRDVIQQAGILQVKKKKVIDQWAYLSQANRLVLRLGEEDLDFGKPRTKASDHQKNAALMRWTWPDIYAD